MDSVEQLVGTKLAGKYSIKRVLGRGGMGSVYEGYYDEIGKRVAVKIISRETSESSEEIEARFRREARAASAIESEHIVQIFDVGRDPNAGLYMVMEFLVGEDLAGYLQRKQKMEIKSAVSVIRQCAQALKKAHDAGVIHRDLKPANIFLVKREDEKLFVKILDFGISKLLRDEREATTQGVGQKLTRVGSIMGTPQYMSPEQAQGLDTVDHRTDIWSLGAVFYEMLSGAPAYPEQPTYEQTIIRIILEKSAPFTEAVSWIPAPFTQLIQRTMDHDLSTRIQDMGTFLQMLEEVSASSSDGIVSEDSKKPTVLSVNREVLNVESGPLGVSSGGRKQGSEEAVQPPIANRWLSWKLLIPLMILLLVVGFFVKRIFIKEDEQKEVNKEIPFSNERRESDVNSAPPKSPEPPSLPSPTTVQPTPPSPSSQTATPPSAPAEQEPPVRSSERKSVPIRKRKRLSKPARTTSVKKSIVKPTKVPSEKNQASSTLKNETATPVKRESERKFGSVEIEDEY